MRRPTLNTLVDALAFAAFLFLVSTGVLLRYTLPPGSGQRISVWGLDRHDWGSVHFWVALIFLVVLSLHLALHWKWIVHAVRGHKSGASGLRAALGLIGLIAALALAAAPLVSPVEQAEGERVGPRAEHQRPSAGRPGPADRDWRGRGRSGAQPLRR